MSNRAFSRWIALQREPVTLEPVKIIGNMGGRQIAEKAGRPAAERGQLFVSFAVAEKLNERLRDLAADDPVEPLVRKWAGHLDRHQWDRAKATIEEIRATPSGEALAGPADATSLAAGSRIWAAVWKEYGKPGGSLPAMSVHATCAHYQGALRWDKQHA